MKKVRRIIKAVLVTMIAVSFSLLIGFTGSAELFKISIGQYILYAVPCIAVFGFSAYLYDLLFGNYIK